VSNVEIDGVPQEAHADKLLIDLGNRTVGSVPHVCYHPQLGKTQKHGMCAHILFFGFAFLAIF
jgi:NADH dehydrogenase/NADH:ubiquinone oxidoreductase subunit G